MGRLAVIQHGREAHSLIDFLQASYPKKTICPAGFQYEYRERTRLDFSLMGRPAEQQGSRLFDIRKQSDVFLTSELDQDR